MDHQSGPWSTLRPKHSTTGKYGRQVRIAPEADLRPYSPEWPFISRQLPLLLQGWSGGHSILVKPVPRHALELAPVAGAAPARGVGAGPAARTVLLGAGHR